MPSTDNLFTTSIDKYLINIFDTLSNQIKISRRYYPNRTHPNKQISKTFKLQKKDGGINPSLLFLPFVIPRSALGVGPCCSSNMHHHLSLSLSIWEISSLIQETMMERIGMTDPGPMLRAFRWGPQLTPASLSSLIYHLKEIDFENCLCNDPAAIFPNDDIPYGRYITKIYRQQIYMRNFP